MREKIVIAIDGLSASGKGTIAKRLAARLDLAHMDTGALYRLVGTAVLRSGLNPEKEADALAQAKNLLATFRPELCEDEEIRSDHAGQAASQVAQFQSVRDVLYDLQVDFSKYPPEDKAGVVLDGRDIGTVIAPHADVKLFIEASQKVRAERRYQELITKGIPATFPQTLADMQRRDSRDTDRAVVPTRPAEDAVILDTTQLNSNQAFAKAFTIVQESIGWKEE